MEMTEISDSLDEWQAIAGGKTMTEISDLLDEWQVIAPGMWANDCGPKNWWAASNNDGIIAYFANEEDACAFVLLKIKKLLSE
jgi:hypothetical protein